VHYSLLAGEKALDSYAYEEAMAHFQRGMAAKDGQPMDGETADLLFGLGRAQMAVLEGTRLQGAADSFLRVFGYAIQVGETRRAVVIATFRYPTAPYMRGLAEMFRRALQLVPTDSLEAGYLLANYALWIYYETGDVDESKDSYQRALALAQDHGDDALELHTESRHLQMLGHSESGPEVYEGALSTGIR
jgi:tetratricopeptide (TPR) repeat protein